MERFLFSFVTFVTILALAGSCYYNSEEDLYPSSGNTCDTLNVTFNGKIFPMLSNNCLSCHSNANAAFYANGIHLEDYADVQFMATVIAGAIKHTAGHSPMPKNGSKLNACLITQFDIWVRTGTPEK